MDRGVRRATSMALTALSMHYPGLMDDASASPDRHRAVREVTP